MTCCSRLSSQYFAGLTAPAKSGGVACPADSARLGRFLPKTSGAGFGRSRIFSSGEG